MKTLAIVCNFVLWGLVCVDILSYVLPLEYNSLILVLLLVAGIMMNILIIARSKVSTTDLVLKDQINLEKGHKKWSIYEFSKFIAVILNLIILAFIFNNYRSSPGNLLPAFLVFATLTLLLSIVSISVSRQTKFYGLKRTILMTGLSLAFLFFGTLTTFRIMIINGIKENISIAQREYPGNAEDALLMYMVDSSISARERTKVSVWTLGQIKSKKALPVLKSIYKEGKPCKHDSELCQYGIHKAIVSIESNWLGIKEDPPEQNDSYIKNLALENYNACRKLADVWLAKLDSTNYNYLLSIDSIKKEDRPKVSSYIEEIRNIYGKINSRKFLGSHIWSKEKLLTYLPDAAEKYLSHINAARSEDGF